MSDIVQQKNCLVICILLPIPYIPPPSSLTIGRRSSRIKGGGRDAEKGKCELSIHLLLNLRLLLPVESGSFLQNLFLPEICISVPSCQDLHGWDGQQQAFWTLPNFKKLIDDAKPPRVSLPKVSSKKSSTSVRERGNLLWVGIGQEIEMYRPPSMGMSELT